MVKDDYDQSYNMVEVKYASRIFKLDFFRSVKVGGAESFD